METKDAQAKLGQADSGIPLFLSLRTVHFDGEGRGTRESFSYEGAFAEAGELCRLSYRERGEDGAVTAVTLSFQKATPCVVKLSKSGAVCTEMEFAEGMPFATDYTVTGLCTLAAEGTVRTVENSLSPRGGRLRLDYTMTVGGVSTRTVMTLEASACAEGTGGEGGVPCR